MAYKDSLLSKSEPSLLPYHGYQSPKFLLKTPRLAGWAAGQKRVEQVPSGHTSTPKLSKWVRDRPAARSSMQLLASNTEAAILDNFRFENV